VKDMEENKTTRKSAIYCRVSTDEQNPEHQLEVLKTYNFNQNIKVKKIYIDEISGTKDSRPALNELMFDMRKGLFNCVVIYKLDRLGRSLKHLINICEEFYKKDIDLICVTQNIDTSTASGKLLFHILGAVAEFERELISERTKLGLKKAKNVGKRGKDKGPRSKSGYYLRHQKKGGMGKNEFA
jgi:DNA invertase Pin-like site-specific DNA recombinase